MNTHILLYMYFKTDVTSGGQVLALKGQTLSTDPPRTLGIGLLYGPRVGRFLMSEVAMYCTASAPCAPPGFGRGRSVKRYESYRQLGESPSRL